MGWGFRWRIKLLPGVAVNVSKSGFSLSLGGAPFTLNLRPGRIRATLSAPGTGLSFRSDFVASPEVIEPDLPPEDPDWKPVTPLEGYRFRNPPPPLPVTAPPPLAGPAEGSPQQDGFHPEPPGGRLALWPIALLAAAAGLGWIWLRSDTAPGPARPTSEQGGTSVHGRDEGAIMPPVPIRVPIPRPRPATSPKSRPAK